MMAAALSTAVPDAEAPMAVPLIVKSPDNMAAAGVVLRATLNFVASPVANAVVELNTTVPAPLLKAEFVKVIVFVADDESTTPPVKVVVLPSASVNVATTATPVIETMLTEPALVMSPLTVTAVALPLVTAPGV